MVDLCCTKQHLTKAEKKSLYRSPETSIVVQPGYCSFFCLFFCFLELGCCLIPALSSVVGKGVEDDDDECVCVQDMLYV